MEESDKGERRAIFWYGLALFLLVSLAFGSSVENGFVDWDDQENFVENSAFRGIGWSQLVWSFRTFKMGVYQPLSWLLLGVESQFFGAEPSALHVGSLILYAIATLTAFRLVRTLLALCLPNRSLMQRDLGAALAVALFAVHPLRTEVAVWASCQPYLPSLILYMVSLDAYLRFHGGAIPPDRWRQVLPFIAFAGALLSKALAVSLPAMLLLLDYYPLRRFQGANEKRSRIWIEKVPYALLSVTFVIIAFTAKSTGKSVPSIAQIGVPTRLATTARAFWLYWKNTVWPLNLCAFYRIPAEIGRSSGTALSIVALVSIAGFAWRIRKRWPWALAVFGSYLIALLPNLGLIRIGDQLGADRYAYLPFVGPTALLAGGLSSIDLESIKGKVTVGCVAATLFLLSLLSMRQTATWRDSIALWSHAATHGEQDSMTVQTNLGAVLMNAGRLDEALAHFTYISKVEPHNAEAELNCGVALLKMGRIDEAITHARKAIEIDPSYGEAYANLGSALFAKKDFAGARESFERAHELRPLLAIPDFNLGVLAEANGQIDLALQYYRSALRVKPDLKEAREAIDKIQRR